MMKNKLKMYINDSIPRLKNKTDTISWIQKDIEAFCFSLAFLIKSRELNQVKHGMNGQNCTKYIYAEKNDQSVQVFLDQFINVKMNPQTTFQE